MKETHIVAQVQVLAQSDISVKTQRRIVDAIRHSFNEVSVLPEGDALTVSFGNLSKEYLVGSLAVTNPDPSDYKAPKADKLDYIRFVVTPDERLIVHKEQSVREALAKALSSKMPDIVGLSSPTYAEVDYILLQSIQAVESYSAGISTREPDFEDRVRDSAKAMMAARP